MLNAGRRHGYTSANAQLQTLDDRFRLHPVRPIVLLLLALGACNRPPGSRQLVYHDKPPLEMIESIERRLAREQCIGSLSRWSRHYRYSADSGTSGRGNLDKQRVIITYTEAGTGGLAGRFIDAPEVYKDEKTGDAITDIHFDDRELLVAGGFYDTRSRAINYWLCGPNFPTHPGQSLAATLYMNR